MPAWTVASLLAATAPYLEEHGSTSPRLDAELLLARVLGVQRIDLYVQHDRPLSQDELDRFRDLVRRRARHEPVAYILGEAHFRYLRVGVEPSVLIPRPETEELVDAVLEWLERHPPALREAVDGAPPRVVDVGTGSGAIALSLAREAGLSVIGVDVSRAALEVARRNAEELGLVGQVEFVEGDLLEGAPPDSCGLVVSNPPYVSDRDWELLPVDVRAYEPAQALRGGADGLVVYRRLVPQATAVLRPGGALFLEVGEGQAADVADLTQVAGLCAIRVRKDLSGKDRIVSAARPGAPVLPLARVEGDALAALRSALGAGALVGVPTDTVYGIAAAWDSRRGLRALREVKGRNDEKPFQVLFPSVEEVCRNLPALDPGMVRILESLLPGPYTLIVPDPSSRPKELGPVGSLGIRVPASEELLAVLSGLGMPLAATSANFAGQPEAVSWEQVPGEIAAACCALLAPIAAGAKGTASTVVDLRPLESGKEPVVLREGAVPATEVLGRIRFLLS